MALVGQISFSHRLVLCVLGALAWGFTAITTILTILNAAILSTSSFSFSGLIIATAVIDVFALGGLVVFLAQFVWRNVENDKSTSSRDVIVIVCCVSLSTISVALTMGTLILLKTHRAEMPHSWTKQIPAQFAIWLFSGLAQAAFYTIGLLNRNQSMTGRCSPSIAVGRDSVISETRQTSSPMTLSGMGPQHILQTSDEERNYLETSSRSVHSWRSSIQQAVRPMTSRTKLLGRSSSTPDPKNIFSDAHSIDEVSQSDGFDTWDTSSVDPSVKDSLMPSAPSKGTSLEPIPGSRPVSPARVLDGPFPATSSIQSPEFAPPRAPSDSSRPPSPAVDESHIHPLFRTDSPTPPPAASPGTVVTASPMSGQVIPRPYSRARSHSRTTSPSPLAHSQMVDESKVRGSSSTDRAMTPPIPQSILSSLSNPDR